MSYVVAEIFKDPVKGLKYLEVIDSFSHIVPRVDPVSIIQPGNKARLTSYNTKSLDIELSDANIESELKNYEISKKFSTEIGSMRAKYEKFSKDKNAIFNRFSDIKTEIIEGVGVDGGGYHPINNPRENKAIDKIEEIADNFNKWESFPGDEDEIFKESVKNIAFWQSCNIGQLPIGTPTQVCSAVIELLSPRISPNDPNQLAVMLDSLKGDELIKRRRECIGLKYLLEGNKYDISDISFKGIPTFLNNQFTRFTKNGQLMTSKDKIVLIIGNDAGTKVITTEFTNDESNDPKQKHIFKNDNSIASPPDPKLLGTRLQLLITDRTKLSPTSKKQSQIAAILFLYTNFFMYGCYIYNLYSNELFSNIPDRELRDQLLRANFSMLSNFLNLINFAIIKKFKLRDENGVELEPDLLIIADAVDNPESTRIQDNKFQSVIKRIQSHQIIHKDSEKIIRIGFRKDIDLIQIDDEAFLPNNFPIVFGSDIPITGTASLLNVDYAKSIEKLTKFLLCDNKGIIPKLTDGTPISVGAPMQNDDIFEASFSALDGYYTGVIESKQIFLQYMDLKIQIFRSGIPTKDILNLKNYIIQNLGLIATSMPSQQAKDADCMRLVSKIMDQYKKFRKRELKLSDDKMIVEDGRIRRLGNEMDDYSRQLYRSILKMKAGMSAVIHLQVAKLCFTLYKNRNPHLQAQLCTNYEILLEQESKRLDNEFNIELEKLINRKKIEMERKFGKNSMKSVLNMMQLVTLNTLPQPPPQFMAMMGSIFQSPGMLGSIPIIPGGPASGPGGPIGKKDLPLEQRLRVEQVKFWQDLRTVFNGRSILLPISKLKSGNIFDDNEFYLLDVIRSMMFNKLNLFKISVDGKINQQLVDARILNNSYIMLCANTVDLSNPNLWRSINYVNLVRFIKNDGTFQNLRRVRNLFFNLIANNSSLIDSSNVSIPTTSNTSIGLVRYCNNAMKKNVTKCNILISRQQFAQTAQKRMNMLSGTMGIDLVSGQSYIESGPYIGARNSNIINR